MKRGGLSLTSNQYDVVQHGQKHQFLSTTSRHLNQKVNNKKCCILYFMIFLVIFVFSVKAYYHVTFKDQIEQAIIFPLYSTTSPHYNFRRNYLTNVPTIHNITRIDQHNKIQEIKTIIKSEEYIPIKLGGGFIHLNYGVGYYIKMAIGRAKKVYNFYIDTGSPFTWLFCNWPQDTNKLQLMGPSGLYNPYNGAKLIKENSRICNQLNYDKKMDPNKLCQLEIEYGDGFCLLNIMVQEEVELYNQFGQKLSLEINLGCGHSAQGGEASECLEKASSFGYDGIIGMQENGVLKKLKNSGIIKSFVLVLCIIKKQDLDEAVGFIIFGKPSFLPHITNHLKWTKMLPFGKSNIHQYIIKVGEIKMGNLNTKYEFPNIKFMHFEIDTGTASIIFPTDLHKKIHDKIKNIGQNKNYQQDTILEDEEEPGATCLRFPPNGANPQLDFDTLHIGIFGSKGFHYLSISPNQYLRWEGLSDDNGQYLCTIIVHNPSFPQSFGMLGAQAIQNTLVVLDIENKRIGWKQSQCNEVQSELNIIEQSINPHPHKKPRYNPP